MSRSVNTSPVGPMRGELLLDRDHGLRDRELVADQSVARGRRRAQSGVVWSPSAAGAGCI
jgi:hypothetical protein